MKGKIKQKSQEKATVRFEENKRVGDLCKKKGHYDDLTNEEKIAMLTSQAVVLAEDHHKKDVKREAGVVKRQ